MERAEFLHTKQPLKVRVVLAGPESGGLHVPIELGRNFRPDMFIGEDRRQFWGQLNFEVVAYPGSTVGGVLVAAYPYDLDDRFIEGARIELYYGANHLGTAEVLRAAS